MERFQMGVIMSWSRCTTWPPSSAHIACSTPPSTTYYACCENSLSDLDQVIDIPTYTLQLRSCLIPFPSLISFPSSFLVFLPVPFLLFFSSFPSSHLRSLSLRHPLIPFPPVLYFRQSNVTTVIQHVRQKWPVC